MLRSLYVLALVSLLACSKDQPVPIGPVGKVNSLAGILPNPTNLHIEAITDSSARVSWGAVEGATDYDVNYKAKGGKWINEPHKGTRLYNTIYDLQANTEYRWAVRAESKDGASRWVLAEPFSTLVDPNYIPPEPYIQEAYDSIYYIDWDSFRRSNMYGSENEELIAFDEFSIHMNEFELDVEAGKVYWVEGVLNRSLMRADLDGSNREAILQDAPGVGAHVWGLALDAQRQAIYWCKGPGGSPAGEEGSMYRASLSKAYPTGGDMQELYFFTEHVDGLTIDPETGWLYFFQNNTGNARGGGRIGSSSIYSFDPTSSSFSGVISEYGGTKPDGLIQQENWGLSQISHISIDTMANKIYWSVSRLPYDSSGTLYWIHYLRRADLDGSNIETLLEHTEREEPDRLPINRMMIDMLAERMYFTQRFGSYASGALCLAYTNDLSNVLELFYTAHAELPTIGSGYVTDFQLATIGE